MQSLNLFSFVCLLFVVLQLAVSVATQLTPNFEIVVTRDGLQSASQRISNSKISQHLLDLQEKNMLKLTIDSFSVPDVPKKDTVFHYICALRGEHVFKCFPGTLESKKYAFTIDPVKEYFVSGSFNLVLYSSFISMQDGKSHISNQFQTDLGRLDISRKADQATINADRLSMLGPNAWRDSCGPLPEVVSSGEPKSPPKASTLLSFVFVFLVIVVPWVSLLYLVRRDHLLCSR